MSDYQYVLTERRYHVGIITLNRPEELNTLHPVQGREMREAILEMDADDEIGALVLTGAGRAFCAGANVKGWNREVEEGKAGDTMAARAAGTQTGRDESIAELWARTKPAVMAINGLAIGAGLTITLGADYRIASEKARLSMRFAAVGVIPEIQSTMLLPEIVGFSRAMDLMLSGEIIDAHKALEIGLVNEVVPHEELIDRAVEKATQYAANHWQTTKAIKQLVWQNLNEKNLSTVKQSEREAFAAAQKRVAHKEAVRAFVEKRPPDIYKAIREE
ncbi:MAG: enoyl-CoA hydratase/isomerase family protein [Pseudomonadales bacterium]|jgi:2-(1,2-epoxy-1,2-dihydrophenyl)acetyl-CoA isomerase